MIYAEVVDFAYRYDFLVPIHCIKLSLGILLFSYWRFLLTF